jgi:hypothetical protein
MTLIARSNREARAFTRSAESVQEEELQPEMGVRAIVHACEAPATDSLNVSPASIETKFVPIDSNCYNQGIPK